MKSLKTNTQKIHRDYVLFLIVIYEWLMLPILCLRLFGWHVMLKQCRAICLVSLLPNDPSVLSNSLHSKSRKFHLPIVYQICLKLVMFLSEVQHQKNTLLGVFWNRKKPSLKRQSLRKSGCLVLSLGQSSYPWQNGLPSKPKRPLTTWMVLKMLKVFHVSHGKSPLYHLGTLFNVWQLTTIKRADWWLFIVVY